MGEEEKEKFRFLTDAEFMALPGNDRMDYLIRAGKELEVRRQKLTELAIEHVRKEQKGE